MQKIILIFALLVFSFVGKTQTETDKKEAEFVKAQIELEAGNYKTADTLFAHLFNKYPNDSLVIRTKANYYWAFGRAHSKKKLLEESIKLFTQLDTKYSNNADIKLYLATGKVKYADLQYFNLKGAEIDKAAYLETEKNIKIELDKYLPQGSDKIRQIAQNDLDSINHTLKTN